MTVKELSDRLRIEARELGLCDQWFSEWRDDETEDTLLDKYKRGLDFCLDREWPSNKFIKENFSEDSLSRNNIYIDKSISLEATNGIYVLNGSSHGVIIVPDYMVVTIFVRNECDVKVVCLGHSKVFITLLDNSSLGIESQSTSRCYVYRKGDNCSLSFKGNVLVR